MDLNKIPLGTPEQFNVLIEIPTGSSNKYEYDQQLQEIKLDYVFKNDFKFPFNYGLLPHTLSEDGEYLDAVVYSSYPIRSGVIVLAKPIGILKLKDRGEQDNKLLVVPLVDPLAQRLNDLADLSPDKQQEIINFFIEVGIQKNKSVVIEGLFDRATAIDEIKRCLEK